ncbi:MAG TPA: DEAD/DEAH box helicase [Geminicoccus sp.]|uniref:DEAD/DEAH box helicase n=1 Tax=Geminicoccus sp. TaxID=2024832 RepID=UPI002E363203|nr:DEAD/DEAH box helicase [Geminicoccus sp.]HEX2528294.1 DEAD/DEAH box helicase [Geminicoccus sp.]
MTETAPSSPAFAALGLREEILRSIEDSGYTTPTPIQAAAIPVVLAGRDVLGIAQTGTGKTASFTLPMIEKLASGRGRARMPRSLILSPTRELATQTAKNFETYGKYLKLTHVLLIGGVGMGDQEKQLEKGVDVLIATPGRMLDWFERGRMLLGGVQIMVIDEADRMLDMGFIPDVERIISLLPARQQTLLFSATMPKEVRSLADRFMRDPAVVEVARPATTATNIDDVVVMCSPREKVDTLVRLIRDQDIDKAIIFSNRKKSVSELNKTLKRRRLNASDIHGDLDQSQRQATLDAFKRGDVDFLVATDVAARGLDVSDMPVVINFDVPTHPDDYVHRIGRTGRAGRKGRAFTFVTSEELKYLAAITGLVGREIPALEVGGSSGPGEGPIAAAVAGGKTADAEKPQRARKEARKPEEPALRRKRTPKSEDVATPDGVEGGEKPARRRRTARPAPVEAPLVGTDDPQPDLADATYQEPAREQASGEARRPVQAEAGRSRQDPREEPVLGFGDALPAFMRIKVPKTVKPADDE